MSPENKCAVQSVNAPQPDSYQFVSQMCRERFGAWLDRRTDRVHVDYIQSHRGSTDGTWPPGLCKNLIGADSGTRVFRAAITAGGPRVRNPLGAILAMSAYTGSERPKHSLWSPSRAWMLVWSR